MKRTAVNMAIDAAGLVAFVLLLSTGLLVRYQLPPGSGELGHGGFGHGAQGRPITLLWGLSRHQWGDIHYWLALVLVAILAIHVVLHWKWVVCVVRGRQTDASGKRLTLGVVGLAGVVLLGLLPLVSSTQQVPRSVLQRGVTTDPTAADTGDRENAAGSSEHRQQRGGGSGSLRGSMTLREAAEQYGADVSLVAQRLGLPEDVSPDERLGRLGQQYGFRVGDVRRALDASAENADE